MIHIYMYMGFPGGTSGKEPTCQCRRHKRLGFSPWVREDPLEEGMATNSSIPAWRMPLVLAQASSIFHSSCEGKLGIALE